ncbi:hypothetical protein JCM19992_31190 [Thermostilla marina]
MPLTSPYIPTAAGDRLDPLPHYYLFVDVDLDGDPGRWRFVLRSQDGSDRFTADDYEPELRGDRLALLTTVRGLEALNCPSWVTVVTSNHFVKEGIAVGMAEWKRAEWRWERFGELVPVPHRDLWERLDRAMRIHRVDCRTWRIDRAHAQRPRPHTAFQTSQSESDGCRTRSGSMGGVRFRVDRAHRPRPHLAHRFSGVPFGSIDKHHDRTGRQMLKPFVHRLRAWWKRWTANEYVRRWQALTRRLLEDWGVLPPPKAPLPPTRCRY